ncbi:hypothetical protein QE152_g11362 [Popillia japonica]|uniref:Transposase n=1 Tax=Popillia japonica TaxID=7064 RepID=A0AAW1LL38_POPJA
MRKIFCWVQVPQYEDEWKTIQREYYWGWNFPNRCVDANYCFRYFDVGTNGRANNGAVFVKPSLNVALEGIRNKLNFPKDVVFVANDAFPLRTDILKPFGRSTHLSRKQKYSTIAYQDLVALLKMHLEFWFLDLESLNDR